jgi:hypothetical protein
VIFLLDDPAASYTPLRPAYLDVGADQSFQLARFWLGEALKNASKEDLPNLPTRVIDVAPEGDDNALRLHVSAKEELGHYVALSYCWGGPHQLRCTQEALRYFTKSMPFEALPLTVRDAVTSTRKLGYRFYWVDAWCIIQTRRKIRVEKYHECAIFTRKPPSQYQQHPHKAQPKVFLVS